jgi:hypothetical protein
MNELNIQILAILALLLIPVFIILFYYLQSEGNSILSKLYGLAGTHYMQKTHHFGGKKHHIRYLK